MSGKKSKSRKQTASPSAGKKPSIATELIDLANQITEQMAATNPFSEVRNMVDRLREIVKYTMQKEALREQVYAGGKSRSQRWAEGRGDDAAKASKIQKKQYEDYMEDQKTSRTDPQSDDQQPGPRIVTGGVAAKSGDAGFGN